MGRHPKTLRIRISDLVGGVATIVARAEVSTVFVGRITPVHLKLTKTIIDFFVMILHHFHVHLLSNLKVRIKYVLQITNGYRIAIWVAHV